MRHNGGWVKLWRHLKNHPASHDIESLGLFSWLMLNVNWQTSRCKFAGKMIEIRPGQIVTSSTEMAEKLCAPRRTLERRLKWLEECGSIVQRVTNGGRLITLVNWGDYQSSEEDSDQRMTNGWPADDQRMASGCARSEEEKKDRREEEKNSTRVPPGPEDIALAEEWFAFAKENSKTVRYTEGWPRAVQQLRELDKIPREDLRLALAFVQVDPFWRPNALSLPGLRQRSKNGLKKIENILAKANASPGGQIRRLVRCGVCMDSGVVQARKDDPGALFGGLRDFGCPECSVNERSQSRLEKWSTDVAQRGWILFNRDLTAEDIG